MTTTTRQAVYDRLADAMEELGIPTLEVARARTGFYSDFETPLAAPKVTLVEGIEFAADYEDDEERKEKLQALAKRIAQGEFDG